MSKATILDETKPGEANAGKATATSTTRMRRWPTPILIPRRVRNALLAVTALTVLAALVFVAWRVPSAPVIVVGGFALALVLSFPVRALSRWMPRGLAVLVTFLVIAGLLVLGALILVPRLARQFGPLTDKLSGLLTDAERYLLAAFELLDGRGLLPGSPEQAASRITKDLSESAGVLYGGVLGDPFAIVSGAFGVVVSLFGVVFVSAYLLADLRRIKVAYLTTIPHAYRHDARDLWDAFESSFSRYINGLVLDLFIQGAVSALVLYLIGVPYAIALGAWVSFAALIPYFGSWLGAIPAVIVAFTVSPTAAILTAIAFLVIQQVEGNFLMPRIQGQALHVHPVPILLAVIVGGSLFGMVGLVLALPALAVVRVLYDLFSVRLRTRE